MNINARRTFLFCALSALLVTACPSASTPDSGTDAGTLDSGTDAGTLGSGTDAGASDSGTDAGTPDSGTDAGTPDSGTDAGTPDSGTDAGSRDSGTDAGTPDSGTDAGAPGSGTDAGRPDSGTDAGAPDGGTDAGRPDSGTDAGTPDAGAIETGDGVQRASATVYGISVDTYTWTDSVGQPRTASLKRQGSPNSGNGGYAVQFTYNVADGAGWRTVTVDGSGEGFGYFVGHELYRQFDDGSNGTIANLHGEDDSPLGSDFAATSTHSAIASTDTSATYTYSTTYPKWGTVTPYPDATGYTTPIPSALTAHQKFELPIQIQWTFQKGMDAPRVDFKIDLSQAQAGQIAFDLRGPYGQVLFADSDPNATINNTEFGDNLDIFNTHSPVASYLKLSAPWTWNVARGNARLFNALVMKSSTTGVLYELGIYQLTVGSTPDLIALDYQSGTPPNRGSTEKATGHNISPDYDGFDQGDWPFQGAQYDGLSDDGAASGSKIAWGSMAFYGSENTSVYYDDANDHLDFPATQVFPVGGLLYYRTCLVLGVSPWTDGAGAESLTHQIASRTTPSCPTVSPLQ